MPKEEIERKFLVNDNSWKSGRGEKIRQGYLNRDKQRTVRIRIAGKKAWLTIKGLTKGVTRPEYEYEIPLQEAEELLDQLCEKPLIEKTRYRISHGDLLFEIDEFLGDNAGLVIAEVELQSENQTFSKPAWLGKEISHDPRYFNSNLIRNPFNRW